MRSTAALVPAGLCNLQRYSTQSLVTLFPQIKEYIGTELFRTENGLIGHHCDFPADPIFFYGYTQFSRGQQVIAHSSTALTRDDTIIRKVSIDGLNIAIGPPDSNSHQPKGKSKATAAPLEILTNAELKLKGGVHYGLLGRNGTGKSSTWFHSRSQHSLCNDS